jgi:hypothetical protein
MADTGIKLYIVTVHLNNSPSFKKTAESLFHLNKSFSAWKWLIKDGNSTEVHQEQVSKSLVAFQGEKVNFVAQEDSGIYDAMNQALSLLSDDEAHCLFLNAGDCLTSEFMSSIGKILDDPKNADILYGDHYQIKKGSLARQKSPKEIDFAYLLGKTINHQSLMIKVKWLKKYPFQTDYKVVADWVQLFSIMKNENIRVKNCEMPIAVYEGGGYSALNDELRLLERRIFLESMYSKWEMDSLNFLSRMRIRPWFELVERSLNSPKRGLIMTWLAKWV